MSDTKPAVQNDNDKNIEEGSIPEQASSNITINMYAAKDEEKDVCGSVLRKEEEYKAGRTKLIDTEAIGEDICEQGIEYIVFAEQQQQGGWWPPQQGQQPHQQQPYQQPYQQLYQQPYQQQPHQQQQATWWGGPSTEPQEHRGLMHRARGDIDGQPIDYSPTKEDRNRFVRKVMLILLVMLLVTAGMIVVAMTVRPVRRAFRNYALYIAIPPCNQELVKTILTSPNSMGLRRLHTEFLWLPSVSIIRSARCIILIFLSCCVFTNCARKPPMNYIMLVIAVILQSLICMVLTSLYSTEIVLIAFAATAGCVGLCVLLACSKFDFTRFLLIVLMVTAALCFISLIQLILHFAFGIKCKWVRLGIAIAFTIVNIVMLTIELQMVLGGRTVELGEEDYALGAYMLYTSIIELFLRLLSITGMLSS